MASTPVYVGIDVACAKGKRLPICVVSAGDPLAPLTIGADLGALLPRGVGNQEVAAPKPFQESARGVVNALCRIADKKGWRIERVAIDAPAAAPAGKRASEEALASCGLCSFQTPDIDAWPAIRKECTDHLSAGGSLAGLPYANKIWMLFGFELFAQLRRLGVEVIEVYPFAIAPALVPGCPHKSTEQGYRMQLYAVAARTGWDSNSLESTLKTAVYCARHDRLDAFMAAWVASLPTEGRRAFGDADQADDAIWAPHPTS